MSTPPTSREIALAGKLAATRHLNVEEREELPGGVVRMSAIVAAVEQSLKGVPFFPPHVRPGEGYDVVIERRSDGSLWMHEQHETSVGQFSPVRTTGVPSIIDATHSYVRALIDPAPSHISPRNASIDGVPIDWGS